MGSHGSRISHKANILLAFTYIKSENVTGNLALSSPERKGRCRETLEARAQVPSLGAWLLHGMPQNALFGSERCFDLDLDNQAPPFY
jgi:hypothetical protein